MKITYKGTNKKGKTVTQSFSRSIEELENPEVIAYAIESAMQSDARTLKISDPILIGTEREMF